MNILRWFLVCLLLAVTACETPPLVEDLGSVAILVLDDFTIDDHHPSGKGNCTYSGEPANEVDTTGGGDGLPDDVAHGTAVFDVLSKELGLRARPTGTQEIVGSNLARDRQQTWRYRDHNIHLIGVDTGDFDTEQITAGITGLLHQLQEPSRGIDRVVLNMSFVIAPCDVTGWFKDAKVPLPDDYILGLYSALIAHEPDPQKLKDLLAQLMREAPPGDLASVLQHHADADLARVTARIPVNAFYSRLRGKKIDDLRADPAFQTVTSGDPLHRLLRDRPDVIPVAAAGNGVFLPGGSGQPTTFAFPFAPASWNSVVSVSAQEGAGPRAEFSNAGEVMLDYHNDFHATGTSFAAPRMSARQAIYLLTGGPVSCAGNVRPPLGYTNIDQPSNTDGFPWKDKTLVQATSEHCPDFIQRAPEASPTP